MIIVDTFEPIEVEHLVAQSVPVSRLSINSQGFADYLFYAVDGHRIQIERKQIHEILGGMDQVEEQLSRELSNGVEETLLLIEGFCEPIMGIKSVTQTWRKTKKENVMVPGHQYNASYVGFQAWLNQLDKAGVTIVQTFDYVATAMTLVALYQNSQKVEHTTLRRYIKDHIYIEPRNQQVLTLMGISGGGIGEEKAKALIERYGTVWYTINQSAEDLAETLIGEEGKQKRLGLTTARRLLKAIGRNV